MPGRVCQCDQFPAWSLTGFMLPALPLLREEFPVWCSMGRQECKETYRILPDSLPFYLITWLCPYCITIVKLSHEPCNKFYHSCMLYPTSPSAGFLNVNKALGITDTTPLDMPIHL